MTPHDIDALAVSAQQGDRAAFRALVQATQRELAISIAAHAVTRDMVEEVLQETYVICFEKIGQYRVGGSFLPWLKTIARNRLYALWRERRRIAELDGDIIEGLVADRGIEDMDQDDDLRQAEAARLAACLERLPDRARALLERRYCEERPLAQLAQQFKKSAATLSVTLFRLRQQLRRCVEQSVGA